MVVEDRVLATAIDDGRVDRALRVAGEAELGIDVLFVVNTNVVYISSRVYIHIEDSNEGLVVALFGAALVVIAIGLGLVGEFGFFGGRAGVLQRRDHGLRRVHGGVVGPETGQK